MKAGETRLEGRRVGRSAAIGLALFLMLTGGGCAGGGGGQGPPGLLMADPGISAVTLYDTGVNRLALRDLDGAEQAFRASLARARASGIDFAPPHEGMARVFLQRGKLDAANHEANAALDLDRQWAPTYLILGRIAEREGNPELALARYEHGLTVEPASEDLAAAAVDLLRKMGREREADELEAQAKAVGREARGGSSPDAPAPGAAPRESRPPGDRRGAPSGASSDSLSLAVRAWLTPFFPDDVEKLSPRLLAVFQQPLLTRGALAVLAIGDTKHLLGGAFDRTIGERAGNDAPPQDIANRPEESWIGRALRVGAIDPLPDGSFRPDQVVARLTLALWLEETVERLRNDRRVFSQYRGQPSPFPDLPNDHYGLNAARLATALGLLPARPDGRIAPNEPVTVAEGVEALRRLPPALLGASPGRP